MPAKAEFEKLVWRKASYSLGNGECIEVASGSLGRVAVRDSKDADGNVLICTATKWLAFLSEVKH